MVTGLFKWDQPWRKLLKGEFLDQGLIWILSLWVEGLPAVLYRTVVEQITQWMQRGGGGQKANRCRVPPVGIAGSKLNLTVVESDKFNKFNLLLLLNLV